MTVASAFQVDVPAIYRRHVLQGLGVLSAAWAVGRQSFGGRAAEPSPVLTGLVLPQTRGPLQNNGAAPWYADVSIGTPPQSLRITLDTGSNFIWSTSSLCSWSSAARKGCGVAEFSSQKSTSFTLSTSTQIPVGFGDWGTMIAKKARDLFQLANGTQMQTGFYLAQNYAGTQFQELDWDGGIGFPSGNQYVQPGISFLMADLMDAHTIDPEFPYVSFDWDPATKSGSCQIGGTDPSAYIASEGIMMPWEPYTEYAGVQHLWSTKLAQFSVGPARFHDVMFCLDSGSSQFKGDSSIMDATLRCVQHAPVPVRLTVGTDVASGMPGVIVVPPSVYNAPIEAGADEGSTVAQFAPLNLKNLVLVGSVLMEHVYTVFEYRVTKGPDGYLLSPAAMYLYNKPNGTQADPGQRTSIRVHGTATGGGGR